jgi:hypothetical protein
MVQGIVTKDVVIGVVGHCRRSDGYRSKDDDDD